MSKFYINDSTWKRYYVVLYGAAEVLDGVVRLLTLGFVSTTFVLDVCREAVRDDIRRLNKAGEFEKAYYLEHGDGG